MSDLVIIEEKIVKRGPKRTAKGETEKERVLDRVRKSRAEKKQKRLENIAVLDMETDPFDNETLSTVNPFAACLYSPHFEPVMIWENDVDKFVDKVYNAIMALPEEYTIYAHNGGKFDFLFLMSRIRGKAVFNGRGILTAKIGPHHLRDSYKLIPERLAAYQKDEFDYSKMDKKVRNKYKKEILEYLFNDCLYLYQMVKSFLDRFGMKLTIGQAAIGEIKKFYKIGQIGKAADETLREWFFGGRVQCIQDGGFFEGDYKLYDVNSMYPNAMANYKHPIGSGYNRRTKGEITENTVFLEITCRNNNALVSKGENFSLTTGKKYGRFKTTIYEYNKALELGLISNVKIHAFIDNDELTTFEKFVEPNYMARQDLKAKLKKLDIDSQEYMDFKLQDMQAKLLLNNGYGKFAQNPRKYKMQCITAPNEFPPQDFLDHSVFPAQRCAQFWVWEKPNPRMTFLNVGTSASITGACRAILMEAIHNAVEPIYCDTDSLICRELNNTELHPTKLGAWDLEDEFNAVILGGKKLYACRKHGQEPTYKIRSKGAYGLEWNDFIEMVKGETIRTVNFAPTIKLDGSQIYQERNIKMTTKLNPRKGLL